MTAQPLSRFFSVCLLLNAGSGWAQGPSPRMDLFGDPLPPGALARMGTVRWRPHSGSDWFGSALAPDGRTIFVSGSGRGDSVTIQVLDVETGRLVRMIPGADQSTGTIAVSPDGKLLAAGGYKGITLWDLGAGKKIRSFKAGSVRSLTFSHDSKKLISGGHDHDRSVRVFNLGTAKEELRLLWHQRQVSYLACVPDGKTLVSAGFGGKISIGDLSTGEEIRTIKSGYVYGSEVALSPDGKILAHISTNDQSRKTVYTLRLLDVSTGKEVRALKGALGRTSGLAFAPDGKLLVSAGEKMFQVWDVATGKEKSRFAGSASRFNITPDGRRLVAAGAIIRVWDLASGKPLNTVEGHLGSVNSVTFSPDGTTLAACSFSDRGIPVWDATSGKLLRTLAGHESYIRAVEFTPQGKLVSGGGDSALRVWDVKSGMETFCYKLHEPRAGEKPLQVMTMGVSRDGKVLSASALGFDGKITDASVFLFGWNLSNGKLLHQSELKQRYFGDFTGFSPDGKTVAYTKDGDLILQDTVSGKVLHKVQRPPYKADSGLPGPEILESPYVFSPDGTLVAVHGSRQRRDGPRFWRDNYAIRLFDTASGKELRRIPLDNWRSGMAFSPDSKRIAAVSDHAARIWDIAGAKEIWRTPELDSQPSSVAFSSDGTRLATGLHNTTILIWDIASTKSLKEGGFR